MTYACDLSYDMAYSLYPSLLQYNLIFTKSTNSAYLINVTSALYSVIDLKVLYLVLTYNWPVSTTTPL